MPVYTDRNYQLEIDQGDDESLLFRYTDDAGTAIDITGYSASFIIDWGAGKNLHTNAIIAAAGTLTITGAITGEDGEILVTITDTQTATIPASGVSVSNQNTSYQLKITDTSGLIETILSGPMKVNRTRET